MVNIDAMIHSVAITIVPLNTFICVLSDVNRSNKNETEHFDR